MASTGSHYVLCESERENSIAGYQAKSDILNFRPEPRLLLYCSGVKVAHLDRVAIVVFSALELAIFEPEKGKGPIFSLRLQT